MQQDLVIKGIEDVLFSISKLAGIGICIYDFKYFFREGPSNLIEPTLKGHYKCQFCNQVRMLDGAKEMCIKSDVEGAVALCTQYKRPFFHTCFFGLTELVVPVLYGNDVIAAIFAGQCRLKEETEFESCFSRLSAFGADRAQFEEIYGQLAEVDRQTLLCAGTAIDLSMRYLVGLKGLSAFEAYFEQDKGDMVGEALRYIEMHYREDISAQDVVSHVHLEHSYLGRLFRKRTGKSISEYITDVRLEKSKQLLAETDIPISSISMNVGYSDPNYFSRCFSRKERISPKEYRQKAKTAER